MLNNSFVNNNILETIGNTPMVELQKQDTGLCRLFVKLENQNPGGSIDKISDIKEILSSGMVPIIVYKGRFIGLITKIDLINYLIKNKIFQV